MSYLNLFLDEVLRQFEVFSTSDYILFVIGLSLFSLVFNWLRFEAWRKL